MEELRIKHTNKGHFPLALHKLSFDIVNVLKKRFDKIPKVETEVYDSL